MGFLRFGVASRVFAGLAGMTAMAFATSLIALHLFRNMEAGLDEISSSILPQTNAATALHSQGIALAAYSSELIAAKTQPARETVILRVKDQISWLNQSISQLKAANVRDLELERLSGQMDQLSQSLSKLDELVSARIETRIQSRRIFADINHVSARLRGLAPEPPEPAKLNRWKANASDIILGLVSAMNAGHPIPLEKHRRHISRQLEESDAQLQSFSSAQAEPRAIQQILDRLAVGNSNVFATRQRHLDITASVEGALSRHKAITDQLEIYTTRLSLQMESKALTLSEEIAASLSERTGQFLMISLAFLIVGGMIFIYVDRSVVSRVQSLNSRMRSLAGGREESPRPRGSDELADMNQSFDYFIRVIRDREQSLEQSRDEVSAARARLISAIESVPAGFALFDRDSNLVMCNHLYAEFYHLGHPASLVGQSLKALTELTVSNALVLEPEDYFRERMSQPGNDNSIFEFEMRNGRWIAARVRRTEEGGLVEIHTDITGRKLDEQQLRHASQMAEQAGRAKTRLLAAASHDLRQPLHAMGLFLDSLAGNVRETGAKETVGKVQRSLDSMNRMFDSLLDLSQINSGNLQTAVTGLRLGDLMERIHSEYQQLASGKGLELHLVTTDCRIESDPVILGRILGNLVSNAVKYTHKGRVLIGMRRKADHYLLQVHDTGPGIPAEHQRQIFEEFYRVRGRDNALGQGLGLSISQHLAQLLGYQITVESSARTGTVFSIKIPFQHRDPIRISPAPEASGGAPGNLNDSIVILIEDDPAIREATTRTLEQWGCHVLSSASLQDVQPAAGQLDRRALAVIADYHLERDETGLDAVMALTGPDNHADHAVILTADPTAEIRTKVEKAGYPLLQKPLKPGRLAALLRSFLKQQAT